MSGRLSVEDLALVDAIARHRSVGAAAKELLTTQPSASRRLATLERCLGYLLFDRDTTGARPTAVGSELARRAARLLGELDELTDNASAAGGAESLSVGTIQALSVPVFTALEVETGNDLALHPEVDHGPALLQQVSQGLLDIAIITIAGQTAVPAGVQRQDLGTSPLVLVLPPGADAPSAGRRAWAGTEVLYSTIDLAGEHLRSQLSRLGAKPRIGPTIEATLRVARHRGVPAVVPQLAARWWGAPGDQIVPSPVDGHITVSAVSRPPLPDAVVEALPRIADRVLGRTVAN